MKSPKTIDEYISVFPKDIQEILKKIRATIQKAAPGAEETINYQMPTFTLKGNLVHFAAFKIISGSTPPRLGSKSSKKSYRRTREQKARYNFRWINQFPIA